MKAQQVAVLLLAACIVCCAAHRDPTYGDDYENNKPYKDGKPGYKYNGGKQYKPKQYKPKEYDTEEYKGKQYKPKEYDSEEYKGKQYKPKEYDSEEYKGKDEYKGKQYKPKEYDSEEYKGKDEHKGKQYKPKEYNDKDEYYKGGKPEYDSKDDYYKGKEDYYAEEKYGYEAYDKYGKEENPDYGPVYNPKAYESYEYDRYKAEYPEAPEYEYPGGYHEYPPEGYEGDEGYGGYDGYDSYDGYGYGGCPVPCDNPHKWPWGTQYTCLDPTTGVCGTNTTTAACPNNGNVVNGKVCLKWGKYTCTYELSGPDKVCRKKNGPCDIEETCTTNSAKCPDDTVLSKDNICKHPEGPCEAPAYCPGPNATGDKTKCTPNYLKNVTCTPKGPYGQARPIKGVCDAPDVCDGSGPKCPDTKQPKTKVCRPANGDCDKEEKCDGVKDDCPKDDVLKGNVCNNKLYQKPCLTGGRCDGTSKTCPKLKHVATGTPCNKDGLWNEAYDVEGNVAVKSKHTKEHADMHGWVECDRCYEGECQHFKWEYWNADGDGDHKSSSNPKSSGSHSSSSKKGGHKSSSYKSHKAEIASVNEGENADDEVLPADGFYPTKIFQTLGVPDPTKASIQSGDYGYGEGHEGHHRAIAAYEPELYCHNPFVTKDYTR